jgi:hypothetical protein
MTPELSPELRQALHSLGAESLLRLVDPETKTTYVLVRAEVFDQMQAESQDDDLAATYPEQFKAAMRAGWDDSAMDAYDNYDENHRKLYP